MKLIEYDVNVGNGHGTGQVIVPKGATDDEIRLAILNDLYDLNYYEVAEQTNTGIICPKCGSSDYIRSFVKDWGITNSEFEYKCINCNTYFGRESLRG